VSESAIRPEGDPDQLLAEASVYLRYGKREQALASLRAILAQDPDHRGALEKLGDAYADAGQPEQAVGAWCKVAEQVRAEGDAEALGVLRDRIAALDPSVAARIGEVESPDSGVSSHGAAGARERESSAPELDLDLEVELDLDEAIEEVAADDTRSGLALAGAGGVEGSDLEIVFEDDPVGEDRTAQVPTESGFELSGDEGSPEFEFEFDGDELSSSGPAIPVESSTADRVGEELEEAEFYLAQEMFDEAEAILTRILESAPDHSRAIERMAEVRRAREGSSSTAQAPAGVADADGTAREVDEITERLADDGIEVDVDLGLGSAADVDLDADLDGDADDTTEEAISEDPLASTDDARISFEVDLDDESDTLAPAFDDTTPAFDTGETFDLREALADVLSDDDEPVVDDAPSGVLSTVEDGFESIFADFKKGVTATLDKGDYDTRYDLGIAYREMGLFEDAIGEFRVCLDSEARRFDSLYLMGLCARDLSQFDAAVSHLEQALALPEIPSARLAGVYFDLSLAHEGSGDLERARASIESVLEIDADFPGAAQRLAALRAGGPATPEVGQPGERFESFDDLFDGDEDESGDDEVVASVPAEAYASLDEVASEVEAELDEDPFESTGSTEPDDTQSRRKGGRKKISFV
jgi:tetratricopeptide (TPR) repeat protein